MQPVSLLVRAVFAAMIAVGVAGGVLAQQGLVPGPRGTRIWNVPLGTPATELPPEFMITACGTNGGPPSTPLQGFHEFAQCRPEPGTGLHEVWFSYDDELEYHLRAMRAPEHQIMMRRANLLFDMLVVYSILFDDRGRMQGYRIASDPREDPLVRINSDMLAALTTIVYGDDGWTCRDLPRIEGEQPLGGTYIKRLCEKTSGGQHIAMRTHRLLKAGQMADRGGVPGANEFDVGVWVEVLAADIAAKVTPAR